MEIAGIIIVVALLLAAGVVSIEFGISVAIIEILLGVLANNFLDLGDISWIEKLSTVGLVGIMFFAGFELDADMFKKHWKKSLVVGSSSYFITFFGIFLTVFFYFGLTSQSSLLLSIGLSTTSLALVYAVMAEKNKIENQIGQIILSAAMVVDVLSMLSLMVLFEEVNVQMLIFLGIFIVLLVFLPRAVNFIFNRYLNESIEFKSRLILFLLLSIIIIAVVIHMHLAIVAFITGFMFSKIIKENHRLESNLKSVIFGFLAPLFFFKAGLSINLFQISPATVKIALILGSVAFIVKFLSTYLAFKKYFPHKVALFSGYVFNYRLSFGIIIATFGLENNLISKDMYIAVLIIVIATSIISTIALKLKIKRSANVTDVAVS